MPSFGVVEITDIVLHGNGELDDVVHFFRLSNSICILPRNGSMYALMPLLCQDFVDLPSSSSLLQRKSAMTRPLCFAGNEAFETPDDVLL